MSWFILLLPIVAGICAALGVYFYQKRSVLNATPPLVAEMPPVRKRLEELSAAEIREVASRYSLKITGKAGNTAGRLAFFALCGAVVFAFLTLFANILMGWAPGLVRFGLIMGAWVLLFGIITLPVFYVGVPQLVGVKSMNAITGRVHTFMPGSNIRYPWEIITENDYLTLRSDVISERSEFTTQDGIHIIFANPSLRWRVFPPLLLLNASHSEETIKKGATDIFKTTLSNEIIEEKMVNLRTATKLEAIQQSLIEALEGKTGLHVDAHGSSFEQQYGVTAEIPALGPPDFTPDYKEALEGQATMRIYKDTAREVVNESDAASGPSMEFGHAFDAVMINAKEAVKKDIFAVQIDDATREAVGNIGSAAGPILAAGAAALVKKKPR